VVVGVTGTTVDCYAIAIAIAAAATTADTDTDTDTDTEITDNILSIITTTNHKLYAQQPTTTQSNRTTSNR
jgi:hypothetical protein